MALNDGGNHLSMFVKASDGTGFAIAPAAAATPEVVKSATLFTVDDDNAGGALTFDASTGKITCAKVEGIGRYRVTAGIGDCVGQNGKFSTLQVYAKEAGVTAAAIGPKVKKEEPATAVRDSLGQVVAYANLSAVGDTVEMRLGVETNADSVTIHDAFLDVVKVGE